MGPRTERSAGQRTFLLLMLIAVIIFGVHFESDCNGFSAQFARESAMLKLPEERRKWDNNITISPTQNTPPLQATSNLPASVDSRSVESVYFCFLMAPQDI